MEGRNDSWIIIALLIALGLGVAIFISKKIQTRQMQAERAHMVLQDAHSQIMMLQDENDRLRQELVRRRAENDR